MNRRNATPWNEILWSSACLFQSALSPISYECLGSRQLALHAAWPATGPGCFLHVLSRNHPTRSRRRLPSKFGACCRMVFGRPEDTALQKIRRLARQVNVKRRAQCCGMHECSMAASDGRLAGHGLPIYVRQEENRRAGVEQAQLAPCLLLVHTSLQYQQHKRTQTKSEERVKKGKLVHICKNSYFLHRAHSCRKPRNSVNR